MSDDKLGPGSPRDVPPPPGEEAIKIDRDKLPRQLQEELNLPDPQTLDMSAAELTSGVNRCPRCGATESQHLAGSDQLMCVFCRHKWSAARVEEEFALGDGIGTLEGTVMGMGARDIEADAMVSFQCSGCGAEVVVNTAETTNARCHWCRHVLGVNEQVQNGAVPDAVLPFHITKDKAIEQLRLFTAKRQFFALKGFKNEFRPENVSGVYLPYMVVDANATAELAGRGEIETRSYKVQEGKNTVTYYDADVYAIRRNLRLAVDDLQVESSAQRGNLDVKSNTNNVINAVLPFDTKNAVKWDSAYLMGHSSEKRDLNVEELAPILDDQLLSIARAKAQGSLQRYDRGVAWEEEAIDVKGSRWIAMYMPVWLYSYQQKKDGLLHYIAVNGRTGKTMGSVPIQRWKLFLAAMTIGTVLEGAAIWLLTVL